LSISHWSRGRPMSRNTDSRQASAQVYGVSAGIGEIGKGVAMQSNDPSSATAGQKTSALSEMQSRRSLERIVRRQSQKTTSRRNLHQDALWKTLKRLKVGFSSPSALFFHLEKWPKTLGYLDKKSHFLLIPRLIQWQKDGRSDITWREILDSISQAHTQILKA